MEDLQNIRLTALQVFDDRNWTKEQMAINFTLIFALQMGKKMV